jgi:hypothetical protein
LILLGVLWVENLVPNQFSPHQRGFITGRNLADSERGLTRAIEIYSSWFQQEQVEKRTTLEDNLGEL